jgi:DNA-binding ferritin-like protein
MENFNLSFPIDMIKKEERIVSGIATADNIDKAGDIVEFEASLDAFKNWGGNIREMHAPIAVGKAISYEPVEITAEDGSKYKAIKVSAYISKGAQDTWEKVLDGTLKAFSIGGKIIEKVESTEKMHRGRPVNIIKQYSLGELSLVDNPANALAIVDIIKMDIEGNLDYVLDIEKASKYKDPKGGLTAAGRRHFKQTEGANLKPGVKGAADTPEKMRRKGSFLTRFFTNPSGPMKKPNGEPTRLALSAAAWGEPVPQNAQDAAALAAKGRRLLERYAKVKNKSIDDVIEDTDETLDDVFIKEDTGTVQTGNMGAGIKNPTQGANFKTPTMPKKKKKKEFSMRNKIKKSSPLSDALNEALSNTIVLYFSAHRAHWNVEGVDFREYHDLFEDIYSDTYGSVDSFAENIRKLGDFPIALSEMEDMAAYEDNSATTSARELAVDLYEKNKTYIEMLKTTFNVSNDANEQGIANFIAERIDMHEKWDWQLRASLGISTGTPEADDAEEEDDPQDPMTRMLNQILANMDKFEEESDLVKMQEDLLQNDVNYDKVLDMNEQEINRLSLLKRVVNWLVPDVQENTSIQVEVTENTQEEEMDIEVLKDALSAVVDDKLATFATSIKEEIEASVQEKIDTITKGFEAQTTELQEKLEATETALTEQEEKVKAFGKSGAIKKSVDPEDGEEGEEITKSAPKSVWNNVYLPQGLITTLGYES